MSPYPSSCDSDRANKICSAAVVSGPSLAPLRFMSYFDISYFDIYDNYRVPQIAPPNRNHGFVDVGSDKFCSISNTADVYGSAFHHGRDAGTRVAVRHNARGRA